MIQVETKLNVADNSGAREAKCIRVLGGTRRRYASVGDIIVVAVNNIIPSSDLKNRYSRRVSRILESSRFFTARDRDRQVKAVFGDKKLA